MPESLRYYLGPAGDLCAVSEPGRCSRYWTLWQREMHALAQACQSTDRVLKLAYRAKADDAEKRKRAHLEECPDCRRWLAECERASLAAQPLDVESEVNA